MRAAALQKAELNTAGLLYLKRILEVACKLGRKSAELGMAEAVCAGCLGLGDEASIGIVNTLGYGN